MNRHNSLHYVRLITWVSLAIILRLVFFRAFPIFLIEDSGDYLRGAYDLYHFHNINSPGIGDIRMPGYSLLLALAYPLTFMHSERIVILQIGIGIACVLLGIAIGYLLNSKSFAEGMALFLGLNPIYLFNEHLLMTETFYLFVLLSFLAGCLLALRGNINWITGGFCGILSAICILIRANSLLFCLVVIAGIIFLSCTTNTTEYPRRKILGFSFSAAFCVLFFLAPWIWRNHHLYGYATIFGHTYRNSLVYQAMHGRNDYFLPSIRKVNDRLEEEQISYRWLQKFSSAYPTRQAEQLARELFIEQVRMHPAVYTQNFFEALACFAGYCFDNNVVGSDRLALRSWIAYWLVDLKAVHKQNISAWVRESNPDFLYKANKEPQPFLNWLSQAGYIYLSIIRPLLSGIYLMVGCIFIFLQVKGKISVERLSGTVVSLLSAGYLATMLGHSLTLTDNERFSSVMDFILWLGAIIFLREITRHFTKLYSQGVSC